MTTQDWTAFVGDLSVLRNAGISHISESSTLFTIASAESASETRNKIVLTNMQQLKRNAQMQTSKVFIAAL